MAHWAWINNGMGPRNTPAKAGGPRMTTEIVIPIPLTFSYPCRTVTNTNAGPVSLPGAGGGSSGASWPSEEGHRGRNGFPENRSFLRVDAGSGTGCLKEPGADSMVRRDGALKSPRIQQISATGRPRAAHMPHRIGEGRPVVCVFVKMPPCHGGKCSA